MRINTDYRLRTLAGENMLVNEGLHNVNLNSLLSLNEPAAWLWSRAAEFCRSEDGGFTEEMLVEWLSGEFDVDSDTAAADVAETVGKWREYGLVTD